MFNHWSTGELAAQVSGQLPRRLAASIVFYECHRADGGLHGLSFHSTVFFFFSVVVALLATTGLKHPFCRPLWAQIAKANLSSLKTIVANFY